jgi:glycosyltransferase involved in cell wall biosynthesis
MLLSISCIAYNQEQFIAKTIESFLMQKTSFPFEIIIHDDASTDATAKIIKEYADKYPDLIIPIYQKENQYSKGINPAFEFVIPKSKGKYIAVCEGDDYWIDPFKLQKQVDFLEANPEYGMVCTDYSKYFQSKNIFKYNCFKIKKYKHEVSFEDYLFDRSTIGTATVIFRQSLYLLYENEIPEIVRQGFNVGDTPLWLFLSVKSKIKVLSDATAVYRILDNSACHFIDPHQHHEFVQKGLEVPKYFIENYSSKKSILTKFKRKKIELDLSYAFKSSNRQLAIDARQRLEQEQLYSLKDRLWFFGSKNQINKTIVNNIFQLFRNLKNITSYVQK